MENGQYDQDWKYIHMMRKKRRRPPMIYAPVGITGACRTLLCWQNTAGTIRTSGWRQLAKDVVAFSHANAGRTGVGR